MNLMGSTSKVYVVSKCGGEYEDLWEHIIAVCSSSELADQLKYKIENSPDNLEEDFYEVRIQEVNLINNLSDLYGN